MKRILFVTGTRADYGKLKPLAKCAQHVGHHVSFWITGMHVLEEYGLTKNEIYRDKYDATDEYINQKTGDLQSIIIAKTITTFTDYLAEKKPDLVIIHGDRLEALACSIAAATNYVKLLHVEGGEVSGTIDEIFRHAISKLVNIHCVSSETAKKRLIRMGEEPKSIFNIGSPELDLHIQCDASKIEEVKLHYEINFNDYGIVLFHPVTYEINTLAFQAEKLFTTLKLSGKKYIVIKPNNDPGSVEINKIINCLPKAQFRVLPSVRFEYFSVLLQNAAVMIGNSSAGVREAPFLGVPSLDIGSRQTNRAQTDSIVHADASDQTNILSFLCQRWGLKYQRQYQFGEGKSIEHFQKLLMQKDIFLKPQQKLFNETYE